MRVSTLLLLGTTVGVALAGFPLSNQACQCLSSCDRDIISSYCIVDVSVCTDASEKSDGKDKCGNLFDVFTEWANWMSDATADITGKIETWTTENVQKIDVNEIKQWSQEQLAKIPTDKITQFTKDQIQALDVQKAIATEKFGAFAEKWKDLSAEQWSKLSALSKTQWDKIVATMPKEEMVTLANDVLAKIPVEEAKQIKDKIKALTVQDVATWSQEQWNKVEVDRLAEFSAQTLQKIPFETVGSWTQEQFRRVPMDKLVTFIGDGIDKIDASKLATMGEAFWHAIPVGAVAKLNVQALQAAGLSIAKDWDPEHIEYMTRDAWTKVPVSEIIKFNVNQLQAINYTALGDFTAEKWNQIPIEKMFTLAGAQIRSIDPAAAGKWTKEQWDKFPASKAVMFTAEQLKAGGAALKDLSAEQLAKFDAQALKDSGIQFASGVLDNLNDYVPAAAKDKLQAMIAKVEEHKEKLHDLRLMYEEKLASDASAPQTDAAANEYQAEKVQYEALKAELNTMEVIADGGSVESGAAQLAPAFGIALLVAIVMMSS